MGVIGASYCSVAQPSQKPPSKRLICPWNRTHASERSKGLSRGPAYGILYSFDLRNTQLTTDPQHELLDVVDDNNLVIATATRGEIHEKGWRHRACHIIVFNTAGHVFLQRRSLSKDSGAGLWDSSSAGHVDSGESYAECAVRELEEELGLVVSSAELREKFLLPANADNEMEFAQVYCLVTNNQPSPDAIEIMDSKWCEPTELDAWIEESPSEFTLVFRDIWRRLQLL